MKYGHFSDNEIPKFKTTGYQTNSYGYRCPEWTPLPEGKKNVVILGCSHTFGEGLDEGEIWVDHLFNQVNQQLLRFWNLGVPGASADLITRILYSTEKVLYPKIIIICWPAFSRRERLENETKNLTNVSPSLVLENEQTDHNNFLKNVFFTEKFAEINQAKIFHCFAEEPFNLKSTYVYKEKSLKSCWPEWSNIRRNKEQRIFISQPSLAKDGIHYGVNHHKVFAKEFYNFFKSKLK